LKFIDYVNSVHQIYFTLKDMVLHSWLKNFMHLFKTYHLVDATFKRWKFECTSLIAVLFTNVHKSLVMF